MTTTKTRIGELLDGLLALSLGIASFSIVVVTVGQVAGLA